MEGIMGRAWVFAISMILAPTCGTVTLAQTVGGTSGSITGTVTDASGGVLPGVTVTISSPSMQGVRSVTTVTDGTYRFLAVPPGEYRITYELAGFSTLVREGVRVSLGFTATINVAMAISGLEETVTVSGDSPVVDVTSTKTTMTFDSERMAALPNARDFWALLSVTPSIQVNRIDVGGSIAGSQSGYSAYDTKTDQHRPLIEGLVMTEGTSGAGMFYDYGAVDEASIGTGGNSAEMPTPGVLSQFVFKSGGNTYHGREYADNEWEALQAHNIPNSETRLCPRGGCDSVQPQDLNRTLGHYDVNGDVGGYIKRDTLWWYGSGRLQKFRPQKPNLAIPNGGNTMQNIMGKVTYAPSQNDKLTGFAMANHLHDINRLDTFLIGAATARHATGESTWNNYWWTHLYKAGWERVINDLTFLELRGGQYKYDFFCESYTVNAPAFADIGNNEVRGGNRDGWSTVPARNQVLATLSRTQNNWAGSHNFKIGGEWLRETYTFYRGRDGDGALPGDVLHVLNNGNPATVYLFQSPSVSENGLYTFSGFVQDTWRVTSRLTVNAGVRVDHYRGFLPAQTSPPQSGPQASIGAAGPQIEFAAVDKIFSWTLPAPRLGVIYDISGSGKTVLKFNAGLYWWNPGTNISQNVNPNPPDWWRQYAWTDGNRNGVWDPGEQGQIVASRGGVGSAVVDPELKDQRTGEIGAWLEREVMPNFGVRVGYVYRRISNFSVLANANRPFDAFNVPVTVPDPGRDGIAGNADDGPAIQALNLNPAFLALPVLNQQTNRPGVAEFHNLEISATKRVSSWWSLQGSFAYRWNRDQENAYFGNTLRSLKVPANPNDTINTDSGRYNFTTWSSKVNGTLEAPWSMRLSPSVRLQSGQPFGRVVVARLNYGNQQILAEPISSQRQDNVVLVDMRAERVFRTGASQSISPFIDVYNIFNANTVVNLAWTSGSSYLLPTTIVAPRIMRLGIKYEW
jgi:hypothetical protein